MSILRVLRPSNTETPDGSEADPNVCPGEGPLGEYHLVADNRFSVSLGPCGLYEVHGVCRKIDGVFSHRVVRVINAGTRMTIHAPEQLGRTINELRAEDPALAAALQTAFDSTTTFDRMRAALLRIM